MQKLRCSSQRQGNHGLLLGRENFKNRRVQMQQMHQLNRTRQNRKKNANGKNGNKAMPQQQVSSYDMCLIQLTLFLFMEGRHSPPFFYFTILYLYLYKTCELRQVREINRKSGN